MIPGKVHAVCLRQGETQKEIKDTEMEDLKVRYSMKKKIF